jgi:hypothetical protein
MTVPAAGVGRGVGRHGREIKELTGRLVVGVGREHSGDSLLELDQVETPVEQVDAQVVGQPGALGV